jgi:hypothetical protein
MFIEDGVKVHEPDAELSPEDIEKIKIYLQGAVYCWCKNCKNEKCEPEWFSVRSLFGGENNDWRGTPLQKLYDWYETKGYADDESHNKAGMDAGHLLKRTLFEDKRTFCSRHNDVWEYCWDGKAVLYNE